MIDNPVFIVYLRNKYFKKFLFVLKYKEIYKVTVPVHVWKYLR